MKKWMDSYFAARKKIEDNDRDSRWEFDKKRLFDCTSYVSMMLPDIIEAVRLCLIFEAYWDRSLKPFRATMLEFKKLKNVFILGSSVL